jgi:hypothetical protein
MHLHLELPALHLFPMLEVLGKTRTLARIQRAQIACS